MRGGGVYRRATVDTTSSKATTLYRVRPGHFIYNRMFAWGGSFAVVPIEEGGSFVSNEFPYFECDEERLLPEYLWLYFQQPSVWERVAGASTGTTASRNRWKEAEFASFMLPLPPLSEQKRIVRSLDSVDAHVSALNEELSQLGRLRLRAVDSLSDATETLPLSEIADVAQGRGLPKHVQGLRTGPISWFKIADMTAEGNLHGYTEADTRMSMDEVAALGGVLFPKGTVVLPRVGAAVLTEKKRILDVDAAVDENHLALKPRDPMAAEVLLVAMENVQLRDYVQTGAVPSLNMALLRSIRVAWPTSDLALLSKTLRAMRITEAALEAELAALHALRAALLGSLLNGSAVVAATAHGGGM